MITVTAIILIIIIIIIIQKSKLITSRKNIQYTMKLKTIPKIRMNTNRIPRQTHKYHPIGRRELEWQRSQWKKSSFLLERPE